MSEVAPHDPECSTDWRRTADACRKGVHSAPWDRLAKKRRCRHPARGPRGLRRAAPEAPYGALVLVTHPLLEIQLPRPVERRRELVAAVWIAPRASVVRASSRRILFNAIGSSV